MKEQLQEFGFKKLEEDFLVFPTTEGVFCMSLSPTQKLTFRPQYIGGLGQDIIILEANQINPAKIFNTINPDDYPFEDETNSSKHFWKEIKAGQEMFADHNSLKPEPVNTLIKNADHAYTKSPKRR